LGEEIKLILLRRGHSATPFPTASIGWGGFVFAIWGKE